MRASDKEYLDGLFAQFRDEVLARFEPPKDERPLLTPRMVADQLSVDQRTVRNWISSGRLKSVKLEGTRRVRPEDLDLFITAGSVDQASGPRP